MSKYVKIYNEQGLSLGFKDYDDVSSNYSFLVSAYALDYHTGAGNVEIVQDFNHLHIKTPPLQGMQLSGVLIHGATNYIVQNEYNVLIPQNISTNIEGADAIDEIAIDNGALLIPFDIRSAGEYYWEATLQDGEWNDDDEFIPMYGNVHAKIQFTVTEA